MRMQLGVLAVLLFGCTTDVASPDARGDGSQGSDASADDGGRSGELGPERDPSRELGAAAESEHAATERSREDGAERTSEPPAAAGEADVAEAGAGATTTAEATASLCGERAVCVTPRADPIEACRASFPAFVAANMLFDPTDCTLVPASTAHAGAGAIRGVAFAMVAHTEVGVPMFAVLEGEHGYDRVVYFIDIDAGINQGTDYEIDAVAIEDLVTGGALEARVELSRTINDSACTEPLTWETTRRDTAVCGIDAAGQTYCTPPIPRTFVEIESTYDYETDHSRVSGRRRFALDVRFDGNQIVVRRARGRVPQDFQRLLGRRHPGKMTGARY